MMTDEMQRSKISTAYTDDGRRVVLKPLGAWADFRIAELLHDVRSPYLPRCLGQASLAKADSADQRACHERIAAHRYEECERLPFVECYPAPVAPSLMFEWINGRTMREIGRDELSPNVPEQWFDDILDGLSWLSRCACHPIAHLDISPDNIVITDSGDALLIDFSGARILDGNAQTPETTRVFKEGYAAPEIFFGDLLPESDLYALAISIISVWCDESASTLNLDSIRRTLKTFVPSFADRLHDCLSEDPSARRNALSKSSLKPIWEKEQLPRPTHTTNEQPAEEDDPCPYSFSTCPFLEVAYILCSD